MKRKRNPEPLELAHIVAWVPTLDALESARHQTQAALVDSQGDSLRGPVEWYQVSGAEAWKMLARLRIGATGDLDAHYQAVESVLLTCGGWVVLAVAPVAKTAAPPPAQSAGVV